MGKIPLAVQLYTLRDLTRVDFAGTLRAVATIGYTGVELAGFGNLTSAADVKAAADDAGLRIIGAHTGIDALETDLAKVLESHAVLGTSHIVIPWLPADRRKDATAWKQTALAINVLAGRCREAGFEMAYHNHSFEFETFDGQTGLDILWANTDPELVKSELDVYWVQIAHQDPVAFIHGLGRRVWSLHLKDVADDPDHRFAEVGTGVLNFPDILAAARANGVEQLIVEQDNTYGAPPLDAIRRSYDSLQGMG